MFRVVFQGGLPYVNVHIIILLHYSNVVVEIVAGGSNVVNSEIVLGRLWLVIFLRLSNINLPSLCIQWLSICNPVIYGVSYLQALYHSIAIGHTTAAYCRRLTH